MARALIFFCPGDVLDERLAQCAVGVSRRQLAVSDQDSGQERFVQVLAGSALTLCVAGAELVSALPPEFQGTALSLAEKRWCVRPQSAAGRLARQLGTLAPVSEKLCGAARLLLLNEPWDALLFSAPECAWEELAEILRLQTPDILVAGLPMGNGTHCLLRLPQLAARPGVLHRGEVFEHVLAALGVAVPAGTEGPKVVLSASEAVYSPEDEKEINRRLEELGYI